MSALDVATFKEIGSRVNDIVGSVLCHNPLGRPAEQVDWEESAIAGRVCVRPHIDEELDNRKHVYNGIDSVLVSLFSKDIAIANRPGSFYSPLLQNSCLKAFLQTSHHF